MAATAARDGRTDLAIVVPAGCGWPLPAYELALLTRARLAERGHRDPGRITVVTAEGAPLALFGPEASAQVAESLREAGIGSAPAPSCGTGAGGAWRSPGPTRSRPTA